MASNVELDAQRTADEATLRQMGEIERSVKESPMVGDATVVDVLRPDYADTSSPGFLPGIAYLACKYATLRRVRGDGNCFYRSLLFAYLETLVAGLAAALPGSSEELLRVRGVVAASKDTLRDVGYEEFATEDFFDAFTGLLETVPSLTSASLHLLFSEGGEADSFTWYMRLLTAAHLRQHADRFFPFLDGVDSDMASYCRREVEPMGRESDQLHIIALSEYLGIPLQIEYLDGREFDPLVGLSCIQFPDSQESSSPLGTVHVTLLYRPGHYDILYL